MTTEEKEEETARQILKTGVDYCMISTDNNQVLSMSVVGNKAKQR
jgi:hypothetical protein